MIRILLSSRLGDRKWTQADLARKTGIRPTTINELYHEMVDRVNLDHLDLICEALDCSLDSLERKVVFMRKKNYKGAKVSKRVVAKCEGVCRTYDAIQYAYANLLSEAEEVKSFQVNVLLQGLEEGAYTSDFVITKADGNLMVRECVSRKHLTKPMTTKLLDASRNYWKSHGVSDWGIVIEEEE